MNDPSFDGAPATTRRDAFRKTLAGVAGFAALGAVARGEVPTPAGAGRLVVRGRHPLNAETPLGALDTDLTPNRDFFIRNHLPEPVAPPGPWAIEIGGLVGKPTTLRPDDLDGLERVTLTAVLQCSGNGRANYRPKNPGIGWDRGAVGQAEWSGVRLADVLRRAGLQPGAGHVHFLGADLPDKPDKPAYLRSIPIARALDPSTIIAVSMNGEPLPALHGGPARLVVPGWYGNHWMKWLRSITPAAGEAPGYFMQADYRMPRHPPAVPGVDLPPEDLVPIEAMNLKSLICSPASDSAVPLGQVEIRGVAWTGEGQVDRVEVAVVAARKAVVWRPATLLDPPRPGAWRRWKIEWDLDEPGPRLIRSKATDDTGRTQPEFSPWNKGGYAWNAIDELRCEVVRA